MTTLELEGQYLTWELAGVSLLPAWSGVHAEGSVFHQVQHVINVVVQPGRRESREGEEEEDGCQERLAGRQGASFPPVTDSDFIPHDGEQQGGHVAQILFDGSCRHASGEQGDQRLDVADALAQHQDDDHGGVRVRALQSLRQTGMVRSRGVGEGWCCLLASWGKSD